MTPTTPTAPTPEELAERLYRAMFDDLYQPPVYARKLKAVIAHHFRQHSAPLEAQIAEMAAENERPNANHKVDLNEIGDTAGVDLSHHSDALLHYAAVAAVKRLHDERNGLLNDIDDAWEAFGTAGNRGVLTLAEQIGSLDRELDEALARATQAEAALAAMTAEMEAAKKRYHTGIQRRYVRFCRMRERAEKAEDARWVTEAAFQAAAEAHDKEIAASQERERVMREALEPFGRASAWFANSSMADAECAIRCPEDAEPPVTFGDFRRLSAAIQPKEPAHDR